MDALGRPSTQPSPADRLTGNTTRAVWSFVALGIVLRWARYALNSPLWWNEAFVAVNLLKRGYADFLRPLDYGQVCPVAFLGVEKAVTDAFGFTEATLRLYPLLCSVASLILFAHVAGRFATGSARWLAVAVLAVAYHPIRLGSEVKPYASDLLASLLLTALALEWLADRSRTCWLGGLVLAGPFAVVLSHPAAFVVGGVTLGLAPAVWRSGRWEARLALAGFGLASLRHLPGPLCPLDRSPERRDLARHAGVLVGGVPAARSALAAGPAGWSPPIPAGSSPTPAAATPGRASCLCSSRSRGSWRPGGRASTPGWRSCWSPFGLDVPGRALRRHPYGGHPRIAQHLAPAICLLIGQGAASCSIALPTGAGRHRGAATRHPVPAGHRILRSGSMRRRPYRTEVERDARDFARRFWPEQAASGRPARPAMGPRPRSLGVTRPRHRTLPLQPKDLRPLPVPAADPIRRRKPTGRSAASSTIRPATKGRTSRPGLTPCRPITGSRAARSGPSPTARRGDRLRVPTDRARPCCGPS